MISQKDREKLEKTNGLRFRVDMACKDCIYDEKTPGTWRKQVENCTTTACPLYPVRPVQIRAAA